MAFDFAAVNQAAWVGSLLGRADKMDVESVDFIGQPEARKQLEPFMDADHFPHTLITGEPGIGKTNLARWIAGTRGESYAEMICPVSPGQVPDEGIVLLDEIHNLGRPEWLYPIMNNVTVTILGATTRPEQLDSALVSRFFLQVKLRRYDLESMQGILIRFAPTLGRHSETPPEWIAALAGAGAGNPRQLERIVKTATGLKTWDPSIVLPAAQITADGLTALHLEYLSTLGKIQRPVGVDQVARMMYQDAGSLLQAERLLFEYELIELTPSGRRLTEKGKRYLGLLQGP